MSERRRRGRPPQCPPEVLDRIVRERLDGHGPTAIARGLTADGVPTPRGSSVWFAQSIDQLLHTRHGQEALLDEQRRRRGNALPSVFEEGQYRN